MHLIYLFTKLKNVLIQVEVINDKHTINVHRSYDFKQLFEWEEKQ